jgi:hypothetical protein
MQVLTTIANTGVGVPGLVGIDVAPEPAAGKLTAALAGADLATGRVLNVVELCEQLGLERLDVPLLVEVLHVGGRDVQAVVRSVVLEVVVVRQLVRDVLAHQQRRLVRPAARNVAHRVAAAPNDEHGDAELLAIVDAVAVALEGQVEAAESVAGQAVRAALQHDSCRGKLGHNPVHDGLEERAVAIVVHAVLERRVDGVVEALAVAFVAPVAGAGEILAEFVQGQRHHAVARVESLLDSVTVVNVDVDVEHALVRLEQLEDAQHAVVDVAEAARLVLLRVVQTAGPVHAYVCITSIQASSATDGTAGRYLAELEETVVDGAVVAHVEALQLAQVLVQVVGRDGAQKGDVVVAVEAGQLGPIDKAGALQQKKQSGIAQNVSDCGSSGSEALGPRGGPERRLATQGQESWQVYTTDSTHKDIHLLVQVVASDQMVGHLHTVGLHRCM